MKLILAIGMLLASNLAAAGAVTHIVAPEHVPTYINPDYVVIESTTVPWSFDMVSEPSILPIIPEISIQTAVVEGVTITEYNLSSDVLFAFDKDVVDEKNHVFVNDIADHILSTYEKIDGIAIVGHTDRLGSDAYNLNLSKRRANTIKTLLERRGLPMDLATTVGAGESSPVTDGCPTVKDRAKLKQCLHRDRRVEIKVFGFAPTKKVVVTE